MSNYEWSGESAERWLRQSDWLDRQIAPVSDLLFDRASLQTGERVLDVGCGTGPTTRDAVGRVGSSGTVTGVDLSGDLLAAAAAVATPLGSAPIEWVQADVVAWAPTIEPVDVVISRFGVMFFSDPRAAFSNLNRATRNGGRLCVVVWDRRDRSDAFEVPLATTLSTLARQGVSVEPPPTDEGPFSLSDRDQAIQILEGAGWSEVHHDVHARRLRIGGGAEPEAAAVAAMSLGPTRLVTAELAPQQHRAVQDALTVEFARHVDDTGQVVLGASVIAITATRS